MKKYLFFLIVSLSCVTIASATSWRINPNPSARAEFLSVDEALKDIRVLGGDTLLLDPGYYGSVSLTRDNITIIGTGYLLDQNTDWSEASVSIMSYLYMNSKKLHR